MEPIVISEIPSGIWNFSSYAEMPIDRSETTVTEFLNQNNVVWKFGESSDANLTVYKDENLRNGLISFRRMKNEYRKRFDKNPYINLNGEAQENSRISYFLADPKRTFSVAPGNKFKRLYFPSIWSDPEIDSWENRLDRICWIGRPLRERIRLAKTIINQGIKIDIFSKTPWPLKEWRGYSENEIQTSQNYKYRIIYENSLKNLYHSEKLFNSLKSGCITFYISDPMLKLPHLEGCYFNCIEDGIKEKYLNVDTALKRMRNLMFSDKWEVYSLKNLFSFIIGCARNKSSNF